MPTKILYNTLWAAVLFLLFMNCKDRHFYGRINATVKFKKKNITQFEPYVQSSIKCFHAQDETNKYLKD